MKAVSLSMTIMSSPQSSQCHRYLKRFQGSITHSLTQKRPWAWDWNQKYGFYAWHSVFVKLLQISNSTVAISSFNQTLVWPPIGVLACQSARQTTMTKSTVGINLLKKDVVTIDLKCCFTHTPYVYTTPSTTKNLEIFRPCAPTP